MSVNFFQHQYSFQKSQKGVDAEDETRKTVSIPMELIEAIFSHLQQMAETTHSYHTTKEIALCISNLTKMAEIDEISSLAKATLEVFQEVQAHLPSDEDRLKHLVDSLYQFVPANTSDEVTFRVEVVKGLAEYHAQQLPPLGFDEEVEELERLLETTVDANHAKEWSLLKELIHETALAQGLNEQALTEKIIGRLKSENEDLLYLLHISIGGLLDQESLTPRMREIKAFLQKKYLAWTDQASARVALMFQEGKSFEEVFQFVSKERQEIAYVCYHFPPDSFGRKRNAPLFTPVQGKYLPWLPKILQATTEPYQRVRGFEDFDELDTSHLQTRTIYGKIGNKDRPLTSFIVSSKHLTDKPYAEVMYLDEAGNDAPNYVRAVICHTPPQAYSLVMKKLNHLTQQLLKRRDFQIQRAAEIHWFFAHLCPLDRGSAAVGEVIIKGLFKALDYKIEWKIDSPPDLLLLTTPDVRDAFETYQTCFTP